MAASISRRVRTLPERHGRTTLALLAAIAILGFGLRAYRVLEPLSTPGADSHAYYALAKALYAEGSYGGPEFRDSSDWSPGAPLLYAAAFYASGGAREGTARIVEALLGVAAIVVAYLLGRRINCRPAGLIAALGVAVYPPFVHSTGQLMSEPPATFLLPAAVLAFLWAAGINRDDSSGGRREKGVSAQARRPVFRPGDPARGAGSAGERPSAEQDTTSSRQDPPATALRWLLPGFLFGLTALTRPEYLLVAVAFAVLVALREVRRRSWRSGLACTVLFAAALLLPIVPWTVRNAVALGRLVPISTGGGKALYVGTYLPADGDYQRVKALLAKRYLHRDLRPGSAALARVDPTPLFDRVAARYPDLPRDSALGKVARQDFSKYFGADPVGYLAMTVRKAWRMWSAGVGEAMGGLAGRIAQVLVVLVALAGLGVLAWRRRWWELLAMATPIAIVTAVGAVALATPRRNEILMALVFPLAGTALAAAGGALRRRNPRPSARSGALA
jgi:4-amino-4-deoxy-L-arabinose transferase-like glycosyltransferase